MTSWRSLHLCDKGRTPEEITGRVSFRRRNAFCSHPGHFASEIEFLEAMGAAMRAQKRSFDARRWYTGDDERITCNGTTYAVSNQWGGRAIEWLNAVLEGEADCGVVIEPAGE